MPKEISDYLNKMGARIPNIKPGKATIEYLTKIQASTRFWGIFFLQELCHWQFQLYSVLIPVVHLNFFNLVSGFWLFFCGHCTGGLLLSALATTSSILDHYLRGINAGFAIGFTSVLIIVSVPPTLGPVDLEARYTLLTPFHIFFFNLVVKINCC